LKPNPAIIPNLCQKNVIFLLKKGTHFGRSFSPRKNTFFWQRIFLSIRAKKPKNLITFSINNNYFYTLLQKTKKWNEK
jgi:hypothetical protein